MKFQIAAAAIALVGSAASAKNERTFAVLRFTNKQLTKARADPIVSPGKVSSHVHSIFGGSGFGLGATGKDLMGSKCSTAMITGDNSAYWVPSLYFKDPKTGKLEDVELFYANAYYLYVHNQVATLTAYLRNSLTLILVLASSLQMTTLKPSQLAYLS